MAPSGVLYTFRRCPYAMRARLAIAASELDFEVREVRLNQKPEALLKASPKGTVPVVELAQHALEGSTRPQVLEESLDIMLFVLKRSDPLGWRTSYGPESLNLIQIIDGDFKTHLDRYKYAARYEGVDPEAERQQAMACLVPFEARLLKHRGLLGERDSMVDAAVFPLVRQFARVEPERFAQDFPSIHRWQQDWEESALFVRVMRKIPFWQPGDEPVLFRSAFAEK